MRYHIICQYTHPSTDPNHHPNGIQIQSAVLPHPPGRPTWAIGNNSVQTFAYALLIV